MMKRRLPQVAAFALSILMVASTISGCKTSSNQNSGSVSGSTGPLGKYSSTITLNAVRVLDSTFKFQTNNPETTSLDKKVWETTYEEQFSIKLNYMWTTTQDQYDAKVIL